MAESPWEWMRRIQRRLEREMEERMRLIKEAEIRTGCIMPLYEVIETETEYAVTIDMPGVKKEEIDLQVYENRLAVEGPCREDLPSRRFGNRYRLLIDLPEAVDASDVKARYLHGVLEIRVKKKKKGRGAKIPVE